MSLTKNPAFPGVAGAAILVSCFACFFCGNYSVEEERDRQKVRVAPPRFIFREQTNDSGVRTWLIKDTREGDCYFYTSGPALTRTSAEACR